MKRSKKEILWEYMKAIITALLLALLIRAYVIQAFKIPSGSMIPTLHIGDHLLVNKFIYGTQLPFSETRYLIINSPQRGDIIVFKYPEDKKRDFIKRVVGIEGDVIRSVNKVLFINGKPASEPYVQYTDNIVRLAISEPRDNFGPLIVPKNKLFVMGDNRDQSYDSRYWGFVDMGLVQGKALIIYWSWDKKDIMGGLKRIGKLIY